MRCDRFTNTAHVRYLHGRSLILDNNRHRCLLQVAQLSAGGSDVDCFADQMQTVFRDALGMGAQKSVGIRGAIA